MKPAVDWDSVLDLGQVPDRALADRLGCGPTAVRYQRNLRSIPPYAPHKRAKGIDWSVVRDFGEVPDRIIAERLGCTIRSVWRQRVKRGIMASTY